MFKPSLLRASEASYKAAPVPTFSNIYKMTGRESCSESKDMQELQ